MGARWQKFKSYLGKNLDRGFKKIIEKFGKFLTVILALSIGLMSWLTGYITIIQVRDFVYGVYVSFVAFAIYAIVEIFKKNGNGNQSIEPQ